MNLILFWQFPIDMPLTCSSTIWGFFVKNYLTAPVSQGLNSLSRPLFVTPIWYLLKKFPPPSSFEVSALPFGRPWAGADLLLGKHFLICSRYFTSILDFSGNVSYSQPLCFTLNESGRINLHTARIQMTIGLFFPLSY